MVKLEDIVDIIPHMDLYPPDCPVYYNNKNQLGEEIESVEYSKTTRKYKIFFKEKETIDLNKLKKASFESVGEGCGFLENEEVTYVYYSDDVLNPIMSVKNRRKIECYESRITWVARIISSYLKKQKSAKI